MRSATAEENTVPLISTENAAALPLKGHFASQPDSDATRNLLLNAYRCANQEIPEWLGNTVLRASN